MKQHKRIKYETDMRKRRKKLIMKMKQTLKATQRTDMAQDTIRHMNNRTKKSKEN